MKKTGFTLIETLVAISMLTITIGAIMGLIQTSLASNTYAQAQVTANYLAGEAIEYIRNIRDTNFLNGADWISSIPDYCKNGQVCTIDTINNTFGTCPGNVCPALQFSDSKDNGFYQYDTGAPSIFTRTVAIQTISDHEIAVRVTIKGASGYFAKTPLVVVEHMYNWGTPPPPTP